MLYGRNGHTTAKSDRTLHLSQSLLLKDPITVHQTLSW